MQIHFWSSFVCSHLEESITFLELFHTLRVYNNTLVSMVFIWALLNTSISSLYIHPFFFFFFFFQIKFTCKRIKLSYYSTSKNSPIPNPNPIPLLISFVFFPSPFTSILKSLLLTLKKKKGKGEISDHQQPDHATLNWFSPFFSFQCLKRKKNEKKMKGRRRKWRKKQREKEGRERENKEENC